LKATIAAVYRPINKSGSEMLNRKTELRDAETSESLYGCLAYYQSYKDIFKQFNPYSIFEFLPGNEGFRKYGEKVRAEIELRQQILQKQQMPLWPFRFHNQVVTDAAIEAYISLARAYFMSHLREDCNVFVSILRYVYKEL
jgi:hypothetical protein